MDTPLVSVIITSYNYDRFLKQSIESALDQTYENLEIVVVDDHSTDNTPEVIKEFLSNDKVKYHRLEKNVGYPDAINYGISVSKGEFIAFLDADDVWCCPNKIVDQVKKFSDPQVGIVYGLEQHVDENLQIITKQSSGRPKRRGFVLDELFTANFIPFSTSMVRKSAIVRSFSSEFKLGQDWSFFLYLCLTHKVDFIERIVTHYRVHGTQMSGRPLEWIIQNRLVRKKFYENNPCVISQRTLRNAKYVERMTTGFYYRFANKRALSCLNYILAFLTKPWDITPLKGAVVSIIYKRPTV